MLPINLKEILVVWLVLWETSPLIGKLIETLIKQSRQASAATQHPLETQGACPGAVRLVVEVVIVIVE